jgi:Tol biopolymer transport system component
MKITLPVLFILATLTACGLLGSNGENDRPDIPGKIVFAAEDAGGNSQIYRMNANGSGLRQLTHLEDGHEAYEPAWSPDGSQIVFSTSLRASSNGLSLYLMDADGGNMRPLHERENSHIPTPGSFPRWSPDGSKIAWHQCVNCQLGTNYELFTYDVATDSVTRLTDNRTSETHPAWSPDGSRIAFVSDRDYVDADTLRFRQDLYLIDADGSNLERLTETGYARNPIWNPHGNAIIFRSSDPETNLGLFRVALQSKKISRIENNLSGNNQLFPQSWSADGKFLLATGRDQSAPQKFFLYIIDTLNNKAIQLPFGPTKISGADWFIPADN